MHSLDPLPCCPSEHRESQSLYAKPTDELEIVFYCDCMKKGIEIESEFYPKKFTGLVETTTLILCRVRGRIFLTNCHPSLIFVSVCMCVCVCVSSCPARHGFYKQLIQVNRIPKVEAGPLKSHRSKYMP